MQNVVLAVELTCIAGVALLAVGIYWKAAKVCCCVARSASFVCQMMVTATPLCFTPNLQDASYFMHEDVVPIVNLVFGVPALAVMAFVSMGFVRRVIRSSRTGKRW